MVSSIPNINNHVSSSNYLYLIIIICLYTVCFKKLIIIGNSSGLVANVLDYDIVVSEFEFQLRYYVYFRTNILGKNREPLFIPTDRLNSWLLFFYKDGLSIK